MRMFLAALVGGVLVGFIADRLLDPQLANYIVDARTLSLTAAAVTAFLGALWGWVAKGVVGSRPSR